MWGSVLSWYNASVLLSLMCKDAVSCYTLRIPVQLSPALDWTLPPLSPGMSPSSRASHSCLLEPCCRGPLLPAPNSVAFQACPSSSVTLIASSVLRTQEPLHQCFVITPLCYNLKYTALVIVSLARYIHNVSVNLLGEEAIKGGSIRRIKPRIFQLASIKTVVWAKWFSPCLHENTSG